MLVLPLAALVVAAVACGQSDGPAQAQSSQTSTGSGSQGPGSTTNVNATGPDPTPAPAPTFTPGETGVTGIVGLNPCPTGDLRACDAKRQPLAATVTVTNRRSGAEIARATSDTNGRYAIRVGLGDYRVTARPESASISCAPVDFAAVTGRYIEVDIDCE